MSSAFIASYFLGQSYKAKQLAQLESYELTRYETALKAVSAISSERGPSNNAMTSEGSSIMTKLHQKRAETDAYVAAMLKAFQPELAKDGLYFADFALLKERLRSARYLVDKLASLRPEARSHRELEAAVDRLFSSADAALALRDKLGRKITANTQYISADILLLNEAGRLRELTGRLGSYVVLLLANPDSGYVERGPIDALRAEVTVAWRSLRSYAPAHLKTPSVDAAVEHANEVYFLGALPYLDNVLHSRGSGQEISAKAFTDQYTPGLKTIEDLRAEILQTTLKAAELCVDDASKALFAGAISFGMICFLLLGFAIAVGRLLFAPLLSARNEILALATGNLDPVHRATRASREIEDIYEDIGMLRQQLLEKRDIEREQARLMETLRFLSERDPLTQLLNRRTVEDIAVERIRDADANNHPLGVLVVDLDHFKRVNDTYGHATGDLLLKSTAEQMRKTLRTTDVVARFGGEEFLVILDLSSERQAVEIAERLRLGIAMMEVEHETPLTITASIGLCVRMPGTTTDWNEIVATADRRLYCAKAQGRNRICSQDSDDTASLSIAHEADAPRLRAVQ